jgi:hypothetical protein
MDPIHPIAPGPPVIPRGAMVPVERLERISRERDRPTREERQQRRDPAYRRAGDPDEEGPPEDDDGRPHIDVRA